MNKHIIYLASGSSRRFGGNKLLTDLQGKPMYQHGLLALLEAARGREECTVSVVSRYPQIRRTAQLWGCQAVDCPDSDRGISHSIRAGLRALGEVGPEDYILFQVADQPWLRAESIERLLQEADRGAECACLGWEGEPGNPALFSARLLPELLALEGDTGGKRVLRRHAHTIVTPREERELLDIDTPRENL